MCIRDSFQSGQEAINGAAAPDHSTEVSEEDAQIVGQIKELLDSRVRPAVAQDAFNAFICKCCIY